MTDTEFFILCRIGKNKKYHLLEILLLDNCSTRIVLYNRDTGIINLDNEITKEVFEGFSDFATGNKLEWEKIPEKKTLDLSLYKIHKFYDGSSGHKLRDIQYTIKDESTNILFTPCCGKHQNHESFKSWGRYVNNFDLFGYGEIEGYQIINPRLFDQYILGINPTEMYLDLTKATDFLIRELASYVEDFFMTTSEQVEIKISHDSGREITVKL